MDVQDAKTKLRLFILKFFRNDALRDDDDIFAMGFVNSLFAMQLIMFIEKDFAIKIENQDLDINNFRSINAMIQLIERKSTQDDS